MTSNRSNRHRLGTALAALAIGLGGFAGTTTANAAQPSGTYRPSQRLQLSVGEGQMINLPTAVANVWTSNPSAADVYVTNAHQINIFGKEGGESTVIATAKNGSVVYGANVRVSQNLPSINDLVKAAMPEANIRVTTIGQMALLNGTVASPADAAFAEQLVASELNPGVDMSKAGASCKICVVSRLKVATPLQVMLKVRIVEINRSVMKKIGVNLLNSLRTGGFNFGAAQGGGIYLPPAGTALTDNSQIQFIRPPVGLGLSAAGKLFGVDIFSSLDLAQTDGLLTTLAEPTLTALSGETASFLAGGEFPVPISQGLGSISVEYKQYGVGLAFTPIVLADGRISMRVRPEVSELSDAGSVKLNGYVVPALTTRRAETTVELGSGQSFMIAGLLQNHHSNNVEKAPFLGDLPILGALFRSTSFQRQETELVIIVTPYLVRPVSNQLVTPADGYRVPTDGQLTFEGQTYDGQSGPGATRTTAHPGMAAPTAGAASIAAPVAAAGAALAAPGFKL